MGRGTKIIAIILVIFTLVAIFVPNRYISRWTPQVILNYMQSVGNDLPKIDGDFSTFGKGLKSTALIIAYPLRLVVWFFVEMFSFVNYFFGGWEVFFS